MLSFINIKFGNINNNKVKKIYNKGDIILIRPPNIKYPYKILSIKEKKMNLDQRIKVLKNNNKQKLFDINDICSISNYNTQYKLLYNNNKNNNNNAWLKKNNSDIVLKKKIIEMEKQKQLINNNKEYDINNIINKIAQRNHDENVFLKKKSLSYSNSKLMHKCIKDNNNNNTNNSNNKDLKINTYSINKEENSKFIDYTSTLLNNEKNKKCYKLKYDQFTSQITLGNNPNDKTNITKQIKKRNKQSKKSLKYYKSNKEIKLKRQKSPKTEGIKFLEKIMFKTKRPCSTDNRKKFQRINLDLKITKIADIKNKIEENKNFNDKDKENKIKKYKKKFKIQKEMKNNKINNNNNIYFNYIKEVNNGNIHNFAKINKFIRLKSRKNSDIFDYIILPPKSEEKELNKDFTEYKSMYCK